MSGCPSSVRSRDRADLLRRVFLAAVLLAVVVALLGATQAPSARAAGPAYFPAIPPPTQITRELTLPQAAQAGVVKLQAKGGSEGDAVSLELEGKKVRAPIVITLRAEMTVEPRLTPEKRAQISKEVPKWANETEDELNRIAAKTRTKSGDPIRFFIDFQYREPEAGPRSNYHQVKLINPRIDKPDDPDFRSEVDGLVPPNGPAATSGTWAFTDLVPNVMAHETLHLIGLDDRYSDVYRYKGQEIPLPEKGMAPAALAKYLKAHNPPIPPPPAGRVDSKDTPGTGRCDIMGSGDERACRKIARRDVDWLESETGLLVTAEPGETLLDKSSDHQNFGIGYQTTVFAAPGSTTVANGIAVYCLDHDRFTPLDQGFDVGPASSQMPGYDGVNRLLRLSAAKQPGLNETIDGMQAAIWNLTDASPLDTSGTAEESRALLSEAGVAENSVPGGLPPIDNPNAGAATTGAVDLSGAVLPPLPAKAAESPPPFRLYTAALYPKRLHGGGKLHADLLLGASGEVSGATIVLQKKAGKRWRKLKTLPSRKIESGTAPLQLTLGSLPAGKYRLQVTVAGTFGNPQTLPAAFSVGR